MLIVNVFIEHPNPRLNRGFSYYSDVDIKKYTRVKVSFNNRIVVGFVVEVETTTKDLEELEIQVGYHMKPIIEIIDDEALLNDELIALAKDMSYSTVSPLISCLNTILPPNLKAKSSKQKLSGELWVKRLEHSENLTTKQLEAYNSLKEAMIYSEFNRTYSGVVKKLREMNVIEVYKVTKGIKDSNIAPSLPLKLTEQQEKAYHQIVNSRSLSFLLHGVTGSGKTELYLQLAKYYLNLNLQVLILVPEIALTPQMVSRVKSRFLDDVAIYHSALSVSEKYEQYLLVKNKKVSVIVGTRSSIFMPFSNLGLIIVDEEHDSSYKQDNTPCYNAKDIAIIRQNNHRSKLVLASATPSLESYARAIKGVYELVELKDRVNFSLPKVNVVDLNKVVRNNDNYIISPELKNAIEIRLSLNEQVILLLNRRGYSPILKCSNCNEVLNCKNCDIAMSYHKDEDIIKCHMCDYSVDSFTCPKCNHKLSTSFGYGVQKVEEVLKLYFKDAKIERMDRDTTKVKNGHEKILKRFESQEIDILIGTQMIAKGLDYPLVTLVAILNGDSGLNRLDYRSQEVVFDLMMQASGRSGRSNNKGEVILQVYNPEHYVVKSTVKQDYLSFFNHEMKYRHNGLYPPYSYLIAIYIQHINASVCIEAVEFIMDRLEDDYYKVLGPTSLNKIKTLARYRIILKSKDLNSIISKVNILLDEYYSAKMYAKVKVDVNPLYLE